MSSIEYAYARWATERLALPTEQQVAELESRLRVELPEDYRQYLLEFNGGVFDDPEILSPENSFPQRGLEVMYGVATHSPSLELGQPADIALFDNNDPLIALPIGGTSLGDLVVLDLESDDWGAVYFKQASADWFRLADGIEEFFANLCDPTWR
jgi:hypothetical protein